MASPDLRSETGRTIDGGVVLRGERGPLRASLEARGFEVRLRDLIRFVPTSQHTAAARNVESATLRGGELGANAELFEQVSAELSWLDLGAHVVLPQGLSLDLRLRDAFDRRGSDLVGYPLPGRQFMATLRFEQGL